VSDAAITPDEALRGTDSTLLVEAISVAKTFGATRALRNSSFDLRAGEVHALVGENGSGKSTLVKILSGVHAPDSGEVRLDGVAFQPRTPRAAQASGIVTVFQEVLVAEAQSVLDNVWLGIDDTWRTAVSPREKRARARRTLDELLGRELDLRTPVEDLSLSDRQACGIVRALLREPRILILDEATSALDVATRDRLFAIVHRLSSQGVGVIFITHRLDEITEIGDRITVMRSGDTVATLHRGKWTVSELVHLMTGSERLAEQGREEAESLTTRRGEVVLSTRGLRLRPGGRPIDLEVRAGELIGVAGLEGHGESEFLEALWGAGAVDGEVVRHAGGREVVILSPKHAAQHDIAYVPRERRLDSLFAWMSIRENFALPTLAQDTRMGLLNSRSTRKRFDAFSGRLGIVLGDPDDAITTLSGGNQQKVVIARWLASGPEILLLNDPTRGIDIGAKNDLYGLLGALASLGLAVVMLSTEVDEHVELMDRVLVFREHELFREIDRRDLSRETLVSAFFGEGREVGDGAVGGSTAR
jgi:ABC-type sugar transport system ATPase subunit